MHLKCPNFIQIFLDMLNIATQSPHFKHFTSVGEKLASKLENSKKKFDSYLGKKCEKTFFLHEIEKHEVMEEIQNICEKRAMGHDDIPPKVIKWCPEQYTSILQVIFNKCIQKGIYPQNMKVAKVVPIHKGGDVDDVNNYRPISILTQFNRIFERILAKRLITFFEKYEIITENIFNFYRQKR